jgi:hypothetical protein
LGRAGAGGDREPQHGENRKESRAETRATRSACTLCVAGKDWPDHGY